MYREMFLRKALFHSWTQSLKRWLPPLPSTIERIRSSFTCTIESLTDAVGNHLNKPEYIHLLLPPLMTTLKALKDDDTDLLPLMKRLASVAKAVQSDFLRFYIVASIDAFRSCTTNTT